MRAVVQIGILILLFVSYAVSKSKDDITYLIYAMALAIQVDFGCMLEMMQSNKK